MERGEIIESRSRQGMKIPRINGNDYFSKKKEKKNTEENGLKAGNYNYKYN